MAFRGNFVVSVVFYTHPDLRSVHGVLQQLSFSAVSRLFLYITTLHR